MKVLEDKGTSQLSFSERMDLAISMNNLAVVEMRSKNFKAALAAAKKTLQLVEKDILGELRLIADPQQTPPALLERLQVLLIAYYNCGLCLVRQQKDAFSTLNGALRISVRFLGHNHYFTRRLQHKVLKIKPNIFSAFASHPKTILE